MWYIYIFHIGNENIHKLTRSNLYMLRVDLTDNIGQKRYAEYNTFLVSNEADNYRLFIGQYCGDSGTGTELRKKPFHIVGKLPKSNTNIVEIR